MRELIFLMNDMDDHVPAEPSFVVLFIIKFNKMNKKNSFVLLLINLHAASLIKWIEHLCLDLFINSCTVSVIKWIEHSCLDLFINLYTASLIKLREHHYQASPNPQRVKWPIMAWPHLNRALCRRELPVLVMHASLIGEVWGGERHGPWRRCFHTGSSSGGKSLWQQLHSEIGNHFYRQ